jgi:hypothetical protein
MGACGTRLAVGASEEDGAVGGDGVLGEDGRGGVEGLAAVQHDRLGVGQAEDEELGGAGVDELREVRQVEDALPVEVLQLDVADPVVPARNGNVTQRIPNGASRRACPAGRGRVRGVVNRVLPSTSCLSPDTGMRDAGYRDAGCGMRAYALSEMVGPGVVGGRAGEAGGTAAGSRQQAQGAGGRQ